MGEPETQQAKVGSLPGRVLVAPTAMEAHGPWTQLLLPLGGASRGVDRPGQTALIWCLKGVFSKSFWQIPCSQASLFYNYLKGVIRKPILT